MFDFIREVVDAVVGFFTGGDDDTSSDPDPCDVGGCLAARDQLESARRGVLSACNWIGFLKATLIVPEWIVSRTIADVIPVLIIALIVGGPGGVLTALWVMGAAWLLSLVYIRAMLPVLAVAAENLMTAMIAEQEAIASVVQECPDECRGDLDPSECSHLDDQEGLVGQAVGAAVAGGGGP